MIDVQKATEVVLSHDYSFGIERVPLVEASGRVLAQALKADRDFPPFNRVTMDGIAINFASLKSGTKSFAIEGTQPAGSPQMQLKDPNGCIEVMTGAVLPKGTDSVIRYEDLELMSGIAKVKIDSINHRQNVHHQGTDRKAGSTIVSENVIIGPPEVAIAATVGLSYLEVVKLPKVVIISTGDELVGVEETPMPHQIRSSNSYQLKAALSKWKISADLLHIKDEQRSIVDQLRACLDNYDVLILSGGVSKGKYDFVPGALEELKVEKLFHRVRQRPGKPFWFGVFEKKATIFALPGNPVSSFMCFNRYFIPWLRAGFGLKPLVYQYARLTSDINFKPDLTYMAQVKLVSEEDGILSAVPIEGHGSGDLANLVDSTAFMELPRGLDNYSAGSVYPVFGFK